MSRTDRLREQLLVNQKQKTSTIVTYVIVNLWIICMFVYLQMPVAMVYSLMCTTILLAARLNRLEKLRVKLQAEMSVAELSFNEDLAMIWQSYMDVRTNMPNLPQQREHVQREEVDIQDDLTDSDEGERQMVDLTPPRAHSRPRGPHLGRPVRPTPHPGFEVDLADFWQDEGLPGMLEDEEDRSARIDIYRRHQNDFNVVCFNRVAQFLQVHALVRAESQSDPAERQHRRRLARSVRRPAGRTEECSLQRS